MITEEQVVGFLGGNTSFGYIKKRHMTERTVLFS
jgi:hypothetical protein